ncbi:unnamed protein product [Fusarium fujikuroi]|uniref:Uncharacterized protein n=1 Tax=Fusarium fujikuroi TaxID=5127 RepID=A0A9Q9RFF6_FUSFU|nr:hypothetical protein CEK25_011772 [Fusarium fujikuroi]VTT61032.1 unnamed protein product [Fusarium fujikuroi]VZH89891.1 unnamed protein product [Fusarium fujikuroi]
MSVFFASSRSPSCHRKVSLHCRRAHLALYILLTQESIRYLQSTRQESVYTLSHEVQGVSWSRQPGEQWLDHQHIWRLSLTAYVVQHKKIVGCLRWKERRRLKGTIHRVSLSHSRAKAEPLLCRGGSISQLAIHTGERKERTNGSFWLQRQFELGLQLTKTVHIDAICVKQIRLTNWRDDHARHSYRRTNGSLFLANNSSTGTPLTFTSVRLHNADNAVMIYRCSKANWRKALVCGCRGSIKISATPDITDMTRSRHHAAMPR